MLKQEQRIDGNGGKQARSSCSNAWAGIAVSKLHLVMY